MSEGESLKMGSELVKEVYKPGDFIFFEGDLEAHFFIVESGVVQIFTKSSSGQRVNIAAIEAGESFGEFALLENQPRSASAQALTECTLIKVSESGFQQLLSELPTWASCMLRSFADRIQHMNKVLVAAPQFSKKK